MVERDQQGLDIPNTATHQVEAQRGTDVVLTLDEPLQWETEQSLIDEVTATHAQGGMAVVVDVTNGDVLAMASIDGASGTTPAAPVGPDRADPAADGPVRARLDQQADHAVDRDPGRPRARPTR